MMADVLIYIGCILILFGAAFSLIAAIGVVRLPDLYTRMHAASKAGAVGGGLIFIAIATVSFDVGVAIRAIFGFGFLLLTTPIAAHILARANYYGSEQSPLSTTNDEIKPKVSP